MCPFFLVERNYADLYEMEQRKICPKLNWFHLLAGAQEVTLSCVCVLRGTLAAVGILNMYKVFRAII